MATIYLRSSDGNDSDDGSTWALAKATFQAAATAAGAAGDVYMDDDHRETFSATQAFTIPAGLKVTVMVTDTTTPATSPNATANLECTTSNDDITFSNHIYCWGISLKTTRTIETTVSGVKLVFENSRLISTASSGTIEASGDGSSMCLIDCEVSTYLFQMQRGSSLNMRGCTYEATSTAPTTLFNALTEGGSFFIDGNDFSAYTGTNIVDFSAISATDQAMPFFFTSNRIPSGVTINNGRPIVGTMRDLIKIHGNGNGDEYYQFQEESIGGYVVEETTIDRQGGATYDGTNLFSLKFVGNSNSTYAEPIRAKITSQVVDASSGATISVHLAYDKATTLNNSDIGLEVRYRDATNEAHGKWAREIASGPADSGDRTAFTDVSGTETWNGTGGWSNANEETIEVTFTGADGLVDVYIILMSNETIYVCPEIEVS